MPENDKSFPEIPESKTVAARRSRFSFVWVIPIVAAVAGIWITVTRILNQGPRITIVFQSAEGLEANKTKINQYVTANTRFWQASGIDMSLSSSGLRVQTESLMSILAGGIAFATPATDPTLAPAEANSTFTLFSDQVEAFKPPARDPQTYLLVFKQSVRGLAPGASVEM